MSIIIVENLKKSFNQRVVVENVCIKVETGIITGLLGRNGAGKTTSFRMITGLTVPDKGAIFLDNENISPLSTTQRSEKGIIYLPQEDSVFMKTTVENNLKMILELKGYSKHEQQNKTEALLSELGLLSLSKQAAHNLSGGERRRLEISRSLALNPKFLLLDEPFTGIDPLTIIELQRILKNLKDKGIGILLSDHNVRDTLSITDYAYVIDNGNILVEGTPETIASDKKAKQKFLGENFKLGSAS
ncbi:MAG: LPS export ABC transporter ATP-binding protein [Candidatus Aminicenantes bacterium]|nr:LPS export ABC transporter ATP-binding protein [Candidatus Aminicenantes bacterium]